MNESFSIVLELKIATNELKGLTSPHVMWCRTHHPFTGLLIDCNPRKHQQYKMTMTRQNHVKTLLTTYLRDEKDNEQDVGDRDD
jgi:hypothetical protein